MSIMKNFFGGSGDSSKKQQRRAHASAKHCNICQEAFKTGADDYRLASCADCVDTGRVKNADYWRQHFMEKRANTLTPDMAALFAKLEENRLGKAMLEGRQATNRIAQQSGTRSREEIKHEQLKYVASLDSIKSQVLDYLPAIVAELGLTDKVDIELVADMLVPAKINAPLHDNVHAKATLRSVVMEELNRLQYTAGMIQQEAAVHPKAKPGLKKTANLDVLLHEGITRISNDTSLSRQIRQANPFAPMMTAEPPMSADPMAMDPMAGGGMAGGGVGEGMPTPQDMAMAQPEEIVGDVVRVDDGFAEPEMPITTMNEGIIPNSDQGFAQQQQQQPDMSGGGMPPQDGGVNRVQQAAAPRVRPVTKTAVQVKKPDNFDIFSFAGRVARNVPVQAIKLDVEARLILDKTPAVNQIIAQYSDGSTKTWNYYLTDKGVLVASKDSEFYAESAHRFADFLSTDSAFVKFAYLPPELMTSEVAPQTDLGSLALPEQGAVGGDPTIDSLQPTILEQPIMEHQDTLLQNQEANVGNGLDFGQDVLLDAAADLLPSFENSMPNAAPEQQMNMALAAAADFLNYVIKTADYQNAPGFDYEQYLNTHPMFGQYKKELRTNTQAPGFEDWLAQTNQPAQQPEHNYNPNGGRPTRLENGPGGVPIMDALRGKETLQQIQPPTATDPLLRTVNENGVDIPVDKIKNQMYQEVAPTITPDLTGTGLDEQGHYHPSLDPHAEEKRQRMVASSIKDILEVTAGMSESEYFEIGAPALIEAGYSDDEIMTAYAELHKEAEGCDTVFSDYGTVTKVVQYTEPTEDAKRGLHNNKPDGAQEQSLEMMDAKQASSKVSKKNPYKSYSSEQLANMPDDFIDYGAVENSSDRDPADGPSGDE